MLFKRYISNNLPKSLSFGENSLNLIDFNISKVLLGQINENNHQQNARRTLIKMLNSLPTDHILISFTEESLSIAYKLNAKCVNGTLIYNKSYNWLDLKKEKLDILDPNLAGTYSFTQSLTGRFYIGSTANFKDRINSHMGQFKSTERMGKALHKLEKDNQESLLFSIIQIIPNFLMKFKKSYPYYVLSEGEYEILLALSLYPVRVLEQSLIDKFKPQLNGQDGKYETTVYHRFTDINWEASRLRLEKSLKNSIPVDIFNLEGELEFRATSSYQASLYLNFNYRSIPLYLNNAKSLFSNHLEKYVYLRSPDFTGKPISRVIRHELTSRKNLILFNLSLEKLNPLFLYCFNEDKKDFITFFTFSGIFRFLFPSKYLDILEKGKIPGGVLNKIIVRINKEESILGENGLSYYIAKNPSRIDNEIRDASVIWLINTETFIGKLFPSIPKIAENYPEFSIRMCNYYRDTGKINKNHIFVSNLKLVEVYPENLGLDLDTLNFEPEKISALIAFLKKESK